VSSLVIESAGLLTTIQDLGRPGFGALGISPSGAADPVALRIGNLLLGNDPGAAALEMTLLGATVQFPSAATVAVVGADFGATLDHRSVEMWTPLQIPPGGRLAFGPTRNFARGYIAVAGGVQVPPFLGSSSTHLLSGLGGYHGRSLQRGDILTIGKPAAKIPTRKVSDATLLMLKPRRVLRVTEGPQFAMFSESDRESFLRCTFCVSEDSDRTGLRLDGPRLASSSAEMITEGVPLGAVQITPSGQPIILFVDQQTTGGYPKIANVIGVDLHRVGQLRPRIEIRFERTSIPVARALWLEQERLLNTPSLLFA